jgi:uncharacterized protein (DUF1684 family)
MGNLGKICFPAILAFWAFGCKSRQAESLKPSNPTVQSRQERDRAYKNNSQSPIPEADRAAFQGLEYFPWDAGFRFHAVLHRYPRPEKIRIATNTGEIRDGLRYGYFEFNVAGRNCRLQAYRLDENEESEKPYLFIPFKDATTGKETYSGGRYLDLPENTQGEYDLDFNEAYNPYCAYGGNFSCPVPPEENWLEVAIQAGEKNYFLTRKEAAK